MKVLQTSPLATWVRRPAFLSQCDLGGETLTYPSSGVIATPFLSLFSILDDREILSSFCLSSGPAAQVTPSLVAVEVLIALRS